MDLTVPSLAIDLDKRLRVANIKATCTFRFTPYEVTQMKSGLRFRAHALLYGDDVLCDDYLAYIGFYFIGESNPSESMSYTFETNVGQSVLNEDWGRDEIIARVRLWCSEWNTAREKQSNTVTGYF